MLTTNTLLKAIAPAASSQFGYNPRQERQAVPNWNRFIPSDFEYDFERDELAAHHITFEEAIECFFSDFEIRRNKSYHDRYQLIGQTAGGRSLKVIFQLKPGNVVRIITGWQV